MSRAGDQIGSYILKERLGRGAFGTVWLAEETTSITTHKVALKLPNEEQIDLEAIRTEAALWEDVKGHPNILPIIKADVVDGQVYIASEYAPDGSLTDWITRSGGAAGSPATAVEMMKGILAGLQHLHSRGVVHRDLKPDNILLQGNVPRIADFGIARALKDSHSSQIAGTPNYMAPEGFSGKRSKQTDIWAAGVIFYQLLTGLLPYPQTDLPSLVNAVVHQPPDINETLIPVRLRSIILSALEKDPLKRYQEVSQLIAALKAVPADELDDISMMPTLVANKAETREMATRRSTDDGPELDRTLAIGEVPDTLPVRDDAGRSKSRLKWISAGVAGLFIIASVVLGAIKLGWTSTSQVGNASVESGEKTTLVNRTAKPAAAELRVRWAEWARLIENSKFDEVIASTTEALAGNPNNPVAYRMRAMAYFNTDKDELGDQDIREVDRLSDDPATAEEFESACYALGRLNKLTDALEKCTKAIEMDPDLSFAYNMRGSLYFQKQMYQEALGDFSRAIELAPRSIFYKNRAAVYYALGQKRQAVDDERRAGGSTAAAVATATPVRNMASSKTAPTTSATPLPTPARLKKEPWVPPAITPVTIETPNRTKR